MFQPKGCMNLIAHRNNIGGPVGLQLTFHRSNNFASATAGWLFLLVLMSCISFPASMSAQHTPGTTLKVVWLVEDPSPESLVDAKEALADGAVVVMKGKDWARFDGLLDVGLLPQRQEEVTGNVLGPSGTLRMMAVHLGPEHSAHGYECYTTPSAEETNAERCQAAFAHWVDDEGSPGIAAPPEPLQGDYTPLFRIERDWAWGGYGTLYDRVRLYRVNDKEPTRDWYLVARDPASTPNFKKCTNSNALAECGWITEKRDFQTSLSAPYRDNANFKYFEASPARNLGDSGTLSIGAGLSGFVPFVGVEYSVSWGQQRVATRTYLNAPAKEASWVEDFGTKAPFSRETPTNRQYFQSHNALIYQVPEGTSSFYVENRVYLENRYYFPNLIAPGFAGGRDLLAAPEFSVSTNSLTVVPKGKVYLRLTAAIPQFPYELPENRVGGLSWTVKLGLGTEGFAVSQSEGSDSTTLTISATTAAPGAEGTLELNTNPPYAAGSVVKSPLIVRLKVASGVTPRVLLAGGRNLQGDTLNSAEQWDPATGKSILTGSMNARRRLHTATQLQDGRVLITGGLNESSSAVASTEFFNPGENTFTTGPNMLAARAEHTATLINSGPLSGDVLIAGGSDTKGYALGRAELYDPRTNTFTWTANMVRARLRHTATAMREGRILVAGGTNDQAGIIGFKDTEIFDPATRLWTRAGNLHEARQEHAATLLTTGQVLVVGGRDFYPSPSATAELYTPTSNSFTYTLRPMSLGRRYPAAVSLLDGEVLVAGGFNAPYNAEKFRPAPEVFLPVAGHMTERRERPSATLLLNTATSLDKKVMFAGGVAPGTGLFEGKLIEVFDPASQTFSPSGMMTTARSELSATLVGTFY